jgi:hypothetical protein
MLKNYQTWHEPTRQMTSGVRVLPGLTEFPGPLPAVLHYARTEPGTQSWTVNGAEYTIAATEDPASGLWWSEVEIEAPAGAVAGDPVVVTIDGETLTLEVE